MSDYSPERLDYLLENGFVEVSSQENVEGYYTMHARYKTVEIQNENVQESIWGTAALYAFKGMELSDTLDVADSISSDVLYACASAVTYDDNECDLLIVLDALQMREGYDSLIPFVNMIDKIKRHLAFVSAPCYFSFMPEAFIKKSDPDWPELIKWFIRDGFSVNVGSDQTQMCLGVNLADRDFADRY